MKTISRLLAVLFVTCITSTVFSKDTNHPHYDAGDQDWFAGGVSIGGISLRVCTQTADDTTPSMGFGTPAGCNILLTSLSHSGLVTVTALDDVGSGSDYEQPILIMGRAAANQTQIADGGNFRLKTITWDSPASGDHSVLELETVYMTGPIASFSNAGGGQVIVTDVAHGLQEDQTITISGASDANYNGTFTVTNVVANSFEITTTWGATDTGTWVSVRFDETSRSGNVEDFFYKDVYHNDADIIDPDVIYQRSATSDVAPDDILIRSGSAFTRATANVDGAPIHISGGVGVAKATCLEATGDRTVLNFTACDATGCTTTTVTEDTGTGGDWDCLTDDNTCCDALEAHVDGLGLRFATTCIANVLWLDPAYTTLAIKLTSANGAGAGTKFAVVDGAEGQVVVSQWAALGLTFIGDPDTGIGVSTANTLGLYAGATGQPRLYISNSSITGALPYDSFNNRIYDSGGALNIGAAFGGTNHGQATGAAEFGKDAGDISFVAEGIVYLDNATIIKSNRVLAFDTTATTDTSILEGTSQTPATFIVALGTTSRNMLVLENGDQAVDLAIPQHNNPTVTLKSADSDKIGEWLAMDYQGLYADHPSTDISPHDTMFNAADAWAQATPGQRDGATHHVSAGIRALKIVCDNFAWAAGDICHIKVNGTELPDAGGLVEGVEWAVGGDDEITCDNLGAAITTAFGTLLTVDCTTLAGTCYLQPNQRSVHSVDSITFVDGAADGVFATLVEGANGAIHLYAGTDVFKDGVRLEINNNALTLRDLTDSGYFNFFANTITANAGVQAGTSLTAGAASFIQFNGLTKCTSPADGKMICGINDGTRGWQWDSATTDGTLILTDEGASNVLRLRASRFEVVGVGSYIDVSSSALRLVANAGTIIAQGSNNATAESSLLALVQLGANAMIGSSGTQYGIEGRSKISQTGTAAYTGIFWDVNDDTSGSGQDYLMDLQWASTPMFQVQDDGDTAIAGDLVVSGNGPHAFGAAVYDYVQMRLGGDFTSQGADQHAEKILVDGTLTAASGDTQRITGYYGAGSLTTSGAAETVGVASQMHLVEPNISVDTQTVLQAATLYIQNAPSEGTTRNAAIIVDEGAVIFDETLSAGGEATFLNNAAAATFGDVTVDADVVLAFDAVTNQGSITYMEDEDRFDFDNDVDVVGNLSADTITLTPFTHHEVIPAGKATLGPNAPAWQDLKGVAYAGLGFDANADEAHLSYTVPACWDGTSNFVLEVHWGNEPGTLIPDTKQVIWDGEWRSVVWGTEASDGGATANPESITVTYTQSGAGVDGDTHDSTMTLISGSGNQTITAGDLLGIHFSRDLAAEGGNMYAADAVVAEWHMEFTANTICAN